MRKIVMIPLFVSTLICSCKTRDKAPADQPAEVGVPVTLTHPDSSSLVEYLELNATSVFMLKTTVKANVTGYLQEVNTQLGDKVNKGRKLFVIRSKEAASLGNTFTLPDSTFSFSGNVSIASPGNGYITQLNYQAGDYVQDGEILAEISDANSLVFLLELPYELKPCLALNRTIGLTLPDGQELTGGIAKPMPMVDPSSQTMRYVVKVSQSLSIPENLIAKVHFIRREKKAAISLPRDAILSDETQSEFWVMKLINDTTAVKTVIQKGIETSTNVEILFPVFVPQDNILLTGNYGLPDTARVSIY